MYLAASAAGLRYVLRHRASPLHGTDRGRPLASAASGVAGRTRGPRGGGLDLGDRRSGLRSRQGGALAGAEPGRSRQEGQQAARAVRCPGHPLAVAVSGANMHDSLALKPLILGVPAVRSRRGPRRRRPVKLRADKAYFSAEHPSRLRERELVARIARPGTESGERLGRHRSKIERSIAWLLGYLRLR
ncbi:transposase [Streptomyces hokutonensis]|uniref:transposase n=1 Tax=Streptomyces hokutonensis TaxID=1306990 RepID=UPI0036C4F4F8